MPTHTIVARPAPSPVPLPDQPERPALSGWGVVPPLPDQPRQIHWLQYGGEMGVARLTPCLKLVGRVSITDDPAGVTCSTCRDHLPGAPARRAATAARP